MAWSGTARRLTWAFGALVALFGVASWYALAGLADIHASVHGVMRHEEGVRAALELASAVRDQYAHQAHTIILGDPGHVAEYDRARERVVERVREARRQATGAEEQGWVDDIARASAELDGIFRSRIVPAVAAKDRETVSREHGRAQELVALIEERADRLTQRFEASIGGVESHAGTVQHATFRWTLVLLIGAMLFAAGVGVYIGRSVARPVARLEAAAAKFAEGELDARVEEEGPDELKRLARQMNAMAAALKEQRGKLVASERLASVGGLAAGVAHEINNPLGVILGYVRVLLRKAEGPLGEDLRIVEEEAVRCQQIVEGLLDLSRPMTLEAGEVDLKAMCDEVAGRLGGAIAVEGSGVARGDAGRIRQVVTNLIKNGVEAGGKVLVKIAGSGGELTVAVEDSGAGIRDEDRARLFEPFFTTKAGGTGLGLAVSRAIARAHGGEIEAGARGEGGAVFTLRLKRAASAGELAS